jgi:hypothetical protein
MATLTCLGSSYCYGQYTITGNDCADVITNVRTELITRNVPAWTEPSASLFKSPVDSAGRFFDILLTRIDAGTLEMRVRDQLARTICTRRIQSGGVPFFIQIYSGQFHFILDVITSGGWASIYAGILDQSPDAQGAHGNYVYGGGYLNTSNTADGNSSVAKCYMLDNGSSAVNDRMSLFSNSGTTACLYNVNGARIYRPLEQYAKIGAYDYRFCGRRYQQLLCTSDLQFLTRMSVPIDNVSGVFQVTAITSVWGYRVMARVA